MALPHFLRTLGVSFLSPCATAASRPGSATGRRRSPLHLSAVCALAFALLFTSCAAAQAAAHLVGEVTLPVNGFPIPGQAFDGILDVAVDGKGDIFFTTQSGLLEELPKQGDGYGTPFQPLPTAPRLFSVAVNKAGDIFTLVAGNVAKYPYTERGYGAPTVVSLSSIRGYVSQLAVDSSDNVFIAARTGNYDDSTILELPLSGGSYGAPRTVLPLSSLGEFSQITLDAQGNIFGVSSFQVLEAPRVYHAVEVKRTKFGYEPPTLLGQGTLSEPSGIAVDLAGNVFVADTGRYPGTPAIFQLSPSSDGTYRNPTHFLSLAGTAPNHLATDARGTLYESETSSVIRKITRAPDFGSTAVRTGAPQTRNLTFAFDSAGTAGRPVVVSQGAPGPEFVDTGAGTCTTNGAAHTYAVGDTCTVQVRFTPAFPGTRYGGVQLSSSVNNSAATAFVQGLGVGPQFSFQPGTQTFPQSGLSNPFGVAITATGDLYLADASTGVLEKLPALSRGGLGSPVVLATGLSSPGGVAVDGNGNVYVAETGTGQVKKVSLNNGTYGAPVVVVSGLARPRSVAVDGLGNLYVTNSGKKVVELYRFASGLTVGPQTLPNGFANPVGVAVDGSGNVFVTDAGNGSLKIIPFIQGAYTTPETLHNGFSNPDGVAVDGSDNVYVAETGRSVIRELPFTDGGYGPPVTLGNGLLRPQGVAVDGNGNLYVADQGRDLTRRVRLLNFTVPPRYDFGSVEIEKYGSGVLSFNVSNNGNAPLLFAVPVAGTNPSFPSAEFNAGGSCPAVSTSATAPFRLERGFRCSYAVGYTPLTAGTHVGQIVFTDNTLNTQHARQVVTFSGTTPKGTTYIQVYPASAGFGVRTASLSAQASFAGEKSSVPLTFQVDAGVRLRGTCQTGAYRVLYCSVDYPTAGLSVGQHTITVTFDGDANYQAATERGTLTITAANTGAR